MLVDIGGDRSLNPLSSFHLGLKFNMVSPPEYSYSLWMRLLSFVRIRANCLTLVGHDRFICATVELSRKLYFFLLIHVHNEIEKLNCFFKSAEFELGHGFNRNW